MKTLLLNGLVLLIVGSPLLALEIARSHSRWIEQHHEGLMFLLWIVMLAILWIWLLPLLGLRPNPRVFR